MVHHEMTFLLFPSLSDLDPNQIEISVSRDSIDYSSVETRLETIEPLEMIENTNILLRNLRRCKKVGDFVIPRHEAL
jgi:hypothetical protein